jgi:hypothetical protein
MTKAYMQIVNGSRLCNEFVDPFINNLIYLEVLKEKKFIRRKLLTPKFPCVFFTKVWSFYIVGKINFSKNQSMRI